MDKQTVLDETEKALDAIEDKLDAIEEIEGVVAKNKTVSTILIGAGIVLVAASSAFAGYKFAERKLKTKYEALAEADREETKQYYRRMYKVEEFATPGDALRALVPEEEQELLVKSEEQAASEMIEAAREEAENYVTTAGHVAYDKVQGEKIKTAGVTITREERVEVTQNVFEVDPAETGHVDFEEESERRKDAGLPYIISEQEYLENAPNYEQTGLTYFEEDDTLVDAADQVIPAMDDVVGDDNMTKFGYGSKNVNTVFIRNDTMECDFEVSRSHGSYVEEAIGIKHDDGDGRVR
jgi:hypothetical protein